MAEERYLVFFSFIAVKRKLYDGIMDMCGMVEWAMCCKNEILPVASAAQQMQIIGDNEANLSIAFRVRRAIFSSRSDRAKRGKWMEVIGLRAHAIAMC